MEEEECESKKGREVKSRRRGASNYLAGRGSVGNSHCIEGEVACGEEGVWRRPKAALHFSRHPTTRQPMVIYQIKKIKKYMVMSCFLLFANRAAPKHKISS